jgi:hypothetical protein
MEVCECFQFNKNKLIVTDVNYYGKYSLPSGIQIDPPVCVNGADAHNAISKLEGSDIDISVTDKSMIVSDGKTKFALQLYSVVMPAEPTPEDKVVWEDVLYFKQITSALRQFCPQAGRVKAYEGILIDKEMIYATDGNCLIVSKLGGKITARTIVPATIGKALPNNKACKMAVDSRRIHLDYGTCFVSGPMIASELPNINMVIGQKYSKLAKAPVKGIRDLTEKARVFRVEDDVGKYTISSISVKNGKMSIASKDEMSCVDSEIDVESGHEFDFRINADFLNAVSLHMIGDVYVYYQNATSPIKLEGLLCSETDSPPITAFIGVLNK